MTVSIAFMGRFHPGEEGTETAKPRRAGFRDRRRTIAALFPGWKTGEKGGGRNQAAATGLGP
ncbi:hypothetical protein GCM10027256_13530 [Novispirillum itersonii subsp. nipponicum]